ncbi:MAG TPA: hypothetical protein VEF76_03050 [Patescibacteria group bacterium]|nr:hypothetical protein [Patescibacteria group bacterium]
MTEWSQSEIDDVRSNTKASQRELEKLNERAERALKMDVALLETFQKVSLQLGELTNEIKQLRNDLKPQLDKPRKLAPPS